MKNLNLLKKVVTGLVGHQLGLLVTIHKPIMFNYLKVLTEALK